MSLQMGLGNRGPAPNSSPAVQSPQGGFFSPAQSRPTFPVGQNNSQAQGQAPFGSEPSYKSPGGMMFNRQPDTSQGVSTSMQNSAPMDRFSSPHMGSGEGPNLPFGPNFASMFRHPPPPSRFPRPQIFKPHLQITTYSQTKHQISMVMVHRQDQVEWVAQIPSLETSPQLTATRLTSRMPQVQNVPRETGDQANSNHFHQIYRCHSHR